MKYVVGIDEVGRGALAGPVVVAAALVPAGFRAGVSASVGAQKKSLDSLRDSKKLSAKQREAWMAYFAEHPSIRFAIARVYPRVIEQRNISRAANLAARRAYLRLAREARREVSLAARAASRALQSAVIAAPIFLDGGLFLGSRAAQKAYPAARTIVKADEKIPAVAVASIIAKVHRDALMRRLHKRHPAYDFAAHKGYATKAHLRAIKSHGRLDAHRLTFLRPEYRMK